MTFMKINSKEIKRLRNIKKLSIRQLAELADVPKSQISDLENEQLKNTTVATICKLAVALGVKAADLFDC